MKDRTLGHRSAQHLLQAQGLTAKLEVRAAVPAGRPVLVLHRVGRVPLVFDQVGFHPFMDGISLQREDILVVGLLPVNQGALPGAISVMLKSRQENGIFQVRYRRHHPGTSRESRLWRGMDFLTFQPGEGDGVRETTLVQRNGVISELPRRFNTVFPGH